METIRLITGLVIVYTIIYWVIFGKFWDNKREHEDHQQD